LFRAHVRGLAEVQAVGDGRWHQVLNNSDTFLETSSTAMYLWGMAEGVTRGWLTKAEFGTTIENAWNGLVKAVKDDGTVTGITEGTGIGPSAEWYNQRSTAYLSSCPGLGSVLRAFLAYDNFIKNK